VKRLTPRRPSELNDESLFVMARGTPRLPASTLSRDQELSMTPCTIHLQSGCVPRAADRLRRGTLRSGAGRDAAGGDPGTLGPLTLGRFSDVSGLRRSLDVWCAFIRHDLVCDLGDRRTCWLRGTGSSCSPSNLTSGVRPQSAPFKARGQPRAPPCIRTASVAGSRIRTALYQPSRLNWEKG